MSHICRSYKIIHFQSTFKINNLTYLKIEIWRFVIKLITF
jgi:hypothetical protein